MKQVMMKRSNEYMGTQELVRVTVLSESGDKMRVKIPGVFHPKEINASDTMPVGTRAVTKMYQSPSTLARDLY